MNLSPLNFAGLIARNSDFPPAPGGKWAKPTPKKKREPIEVTAWRCPSCEELHAWEGEAKDCCADEDEDSTSHEEGSSDCPVCGLGYPEPRVAADCCLWKDLDAPTRWAMADAVEAGSTWQEQLNLRS